MKKGLLFSPITRAILPPTEVSEQPSSWLAPLHLPAITVLNQGRGPEAEKSASCSPPPTHTHTFSPGPPGTNGEICVYLYDWWEEG